MQVKEVGSQDVQLLGAREALEVELVVLAHALFPLIPRRVPLRHRRGLLMAVQD